MSNKRRRLTVTSAWVDEEVEEGKEVKEKKDSCREDTELQGYLNAVNSKIQQGKELRLKYINNSFKLRYRDPKHSIPFGIILTLTSGLYSILCKLSPYT